jgi:hypothetical protein
MADTPVGVNVITRLVCAVALLAAVSAACSKRESQPRGDAHTPPAAVFRAYLERDLQRFFSKRHGATVGVKYELLRDQPTAAPSYPQYYAWVRVENASALVEEGAARVAAVDQSQFYINDFVPAAEIVKGAPELERIFPAALLPDIRRRAGAH